MKWRRILLAGFGVPVVALLLITLVVTGYAFKLAFEVRGAPDQTRITQFAEHLGRTWWSVLTILLTVFAAALVTRKMHTSAVRQGAVVGVIVAAVGLLLGFTLSLRSVAEGILTVGAGCLGGAIGMWARGHPPSETGGNRASHH